MVTVVNNAVRIEGDDDEKREMEIRGQSIIEQAPRSITITSSEVMEAIENPLQSIIEAVSMALNNAPPELSADIFNKGMVITGGGALLYGLAEAIGSVLNIPCRVAEDARDCVVLGCAKVLTDPSGMRHLLTV